MPDDPLEWLEENTEWESEEPDSLDKDFVEQVDGILNCVDDMNQNGVIDTILIIVNDIDDNQIVFTNIDRNDLIIGCLTTAALNWHSTQRHLQVDDNSEEAGEGVE